MLSRFTGPQRRAIVVFGGLWALGFVFLAVRAFAGG